MYKIETKTNNSSYFESKYCMHVNSYYANRYLAFKLKIIYPIKNLFYRFLVNHIIKTHINSHQYGVVICAIFKNEGRFLKEWIEYHHMIGISHFFMYNNNSTDDFRAILSPYIDSGIVTLIDWPQIPGQIPAYKHWYDNYRKMCSWCSFLDLDEFICPKYDYDIASWLQKKERYPVIRINWLMFGTSSLEKHQNEKLVIEQYTHCWNKPVNIGKVFYNCSFEIAQFDNSMHHSLVVKWKNIKIPPFNDSGNICIAYCHQRFSKNGDTIQINHYYSRAYDILKEKLSKGDSAYIVLGEKESLPYLKREMNCINVDYTIQRYLLQLKLILNKRDF